MFGKRFSSEYALSRFLHIIEAALEYFIYLMVTGAYLARITSELGFSDSLTGILSSFVSMGCVFRLLAIACFRNKTSVKRSVILCGILNEALFGLVYLTPIFPLSAAGKTAVFLVFYVCAYFLLNLSAPPKTTWTLNLIDDNARGRFTAKKEMVSLLGGMLFTYLMGVAIDALEAAGQQRLSFILGAVAIFVLMLGYTLCLVLMKEVPISQEKGGGSLKSILHHKKFWRIVPVILLWNIGTSCATPFYGAYQIKELGFSMTFISVLSILSSLVRIAVSPLTGRYADRHSFSRMVTICFIIAGLSFLINTQTVPENGKVFFAIYSCLAAISMAGINSALVNLIYDHVQGQDRMNALSISSALGGLCGFGATCLMSPIVARIQENGNRIFSLNLYPTQFVSGVAFLITVILVAYLILVILPHEKKAPRF